MSLVFAGVCSHAPGITGRKDRADPVVRDAFYAALRGFEWNAYMEAMREGERKYGPVRTGLYTRAAGR